jgi:hypothetical protein
VVWGFAMRESFEHDVTILHQKLADGRGFLRLTHRPSQLYVESFLETQSVVDLSRGLMKKLKELVSCRWGGAS